MADSLVLTGVRQVTKHTGDEMVRLDYPRGGNTWQIKRWWVQGNGAVYEDCTVFKVTGAGGSGYLALLASPSVNVRIDHDGNFGFNFYQINELARAALYNDSWELVEHYVMPRISGGKVMTVTPADGAANPGGGGTPATTVDSATVSGDNTPVENTASVYAVAVTGDATPYTYSWSATGGTVTSGGTTASATITWGAAGAGSVTCSVSSTNANFDGTGQSDTLSVTIAT